MKSPEEVEIGLDSNVNVGPHPNSQTLSLASDGDPGITVLQTATVETQDTILSNVTVSRQTGASFDTIERSDHTERTNQTTRKINRNDVKQIFRGSTTTGTVSIEQLTRIKRMHEKISDGVKWDFNYCCLLMVASVVAGLGLAMDSSTTVISSMLLSPIMGPVIGMSYGLCIWDLPLIYRSARNEIMSVIVCVIFGLIIGLACHWTIMAESWPTQEMISRGTRTTFLAGIPIAFFSGLGVALSILDDQTSSLVGVAISASLLPPAVNCGMLFIVAAIYDDGEHPTLGDAFAEENAKDTPKSFQQMAIISLLLTVANVVMVALGSALMFRAKEVLPVNKKIFWDDLKTARRIYQGRAVDSITGEPLTVEQLYHAYQRQCEGPSQNVPGGMPNIPEEQVHSDHDTPNESQDKTQ